VARRVIFLPHWSAHRPPSHRGFIGVGFAQFFFLSSVLSPPRKFGLFPLGRSRSFLDRISKTVSSLGAPQSLRLVCSYGTTRRLLPPTRFSAGVHILVNANFFFLKVFPLELSFALKFPV